MRLAPASASSIVHVAAVGRRGSIALTSVLALLILVACGPPSPAARSASSPPTSPGPSANASARQPAAGSQSPSTDWHTDWEQTLAAAKAEGKVAVITSTGQGIREALMTFQDRFGITLQLVPVAGASEYGPRVGSERQAGQFLWDVAQLDPVGLFSILRPIGALDRLAPAFIDPDITSDSNWHGGFASGWIDRDKSLVYEFVRYVTWNVSVNRDAVPESQLSKINQLWLPSWKGKIAIQDPRLPSSGAGVLGNWLYNKGEDELRTFLRDMQPVTTKDSRQLAEWLVRGTYPIVIAVSPTVMNEFTKQGVNLQHVKPLVDDDPAATKVGDGSGALSVFNRTPHPNAAKVFINWMLSKEGQTIYAQRTGYNVRRLDAPVVDPDKALDPKKTYIDPQAEENDDYQAKAIEIAKEILK